MGIAIYKRVCMDANSRESALAQAKERGFELSSDGTKWVRINSSSVNPPVSSGRKKSTNILMIGMLITSMLLTVFAIFGSSWISLETENQQIHYALNGDRETDNYNSGAFSEALTLYSGDLTLSMYNNVLLGTVVKIGLWLGVLFGITKSIFIILDKNELEAFHEIPRVALWFNVFTGIMWGFVVGIFSIWGLFIGWRLGPSFHFGIHYWMALAGGALAYIVSFMTKSVDSSVLLSTKNK
jgi:hypothetical protein